VCDALHREWKPGTLARIDSISRAQWSLICADAHAQDVGLLGWHHDFGNWRDFPASCGLRASDRGSYVVGLYIRPQWRSRGIGEQVIQWLATAAQEVGSPLLVAMPDTTDEEGLDPRVWFFEKCGLTWVVPDEPWLKPQMMHLRIHELPLTRQMNSRADRI
jgi:GNAT superfamily N-acetyltransferase